MENPQALPSDHRTMTIGLAPETLVDVQDGILTACTDLERLVFLFSAAAAEVNTRFMTASTLIDQLRAQRQGDAAQLDALQAHLAHAIVALQIDDMATQLVDHTKRVLRHCADSLAAGTFADGDGDDEVIEARPLRPSPVTQAGMDAGSIELF
jgi:hypothetical protein